jgi:hypothetical protein
MLLDTSSISTKIRSNLQHSLSETRKNILSFPVGPCFFISWIGGFFKYIYIDIDIDIDR